MGDSITIAPSVVIITAVHTATSIEGVARMGHVPDSVSRLFRGHPQGNGVVLEYLSEDEVKVDVYIIAGAGKNLIDVSRAVQQRVSRAIHDLVGIEVSTVNVHVEDVEYTD